jgi:hypothetical protein
MILYRGRQFSSSSRMGARRLRTLSQMESDIVRALCGRFRSMNARILTKIRQELA